VELNTEGETVMSEKARDFHFNVNVRTGSGSKAKMANNEDSFLRAMEILERRREKEELENPKQEEITVPEEIPVENQEEEEKAAEIIEVEPTAETSPPVEPAKAPPAPKPSGGGVPGPTPRRDFTDAEKADMLKRAKAHAAEVAVRKNK
jgi:hypothetical protein